MDNFDEAKRATEDMLNSQEEMSDNSNPTAEENETNEVNPQVREGENQPTQPTESNNETDEAVRLAQIATQTAQNRDEQLNRLMAEMEQLRQSNNELQRLVTEQSQAREREIIEEATEMPMLDVNRLAFESEEASRQMQEEYAQKMREYVMDKVMKDIEPALRFAKDGIREKEKSEMLSAFKDVDELQGIDELMPQLEYIIEHNKWLNSEDIPLDERYLTAYMIAKGANGMNTPPKTEPTAEELMRYYEQNPEFQQLIDKKRLDDIKDSQQVPVMSASNGAVNAALTIKEKPKTWDDAFSRTNAMLRGK